MLNPNSLKAKPADNYDDLKKQFFALKNLCESKIKQCSIYSNKLAEYDRESILARSEALESEKEMNAQLTEELAKANERVAKLESENTNGNAAAELLIWWAQKLSNAPNEDLKEVIRIGYKRIVNLANLIGEEQLRKEQD